MNNNKIFAVITGDVVGSSKMKAEERKKLLNVLKSSFARLDEILGDEFIYFPFEIFRGDSFQGVLSKPELALKTAILIRAGIRNGIKTRVKDAVDARIAIGIGTIDFLPTEKGGEGDGEAYRNSGLLLDDKKKSHQRIFIKTPWENINDELTTEFFLLDAIVSRWTNQQVEIVFEYFKGLTQEEMAEKFNISQPAVRKRLNNLNIDALEMANSRFSKLIIGD